MFSCCVVYVRAQVQLFPHSSFLANCHQPCCHVFCEDKSSDITRWKSSVTAVHFSMRKVTCSATKNVLNSLSVNI